MNGQTLILSGDRQRQLAKSLIDRAPPMAVLNIREAKRTNDQNAKWHAMISDIARAKPDGRVYDVPTWKALLMSDAGFKPIFQPSLDGQGVVPIGFKSSRLRKSEFSDLIEATFAFGARHNVVWSSDEGNGE